MKTICSGNSYCGAVQWALQAGDLDIWSDPGKHFYRNSSRICLEQTSLVVNNERWQVPEVLHWLSLFKFKRLEVRVDKYDVKRASSMQPILLHLSCYRGRSPSPTECLPFLEVWLEPSWFDPKFTKIESLHFKLHNASSSSQSET